MIRYTKNLLGNNIWENFTINTKNKTNLGCVNKASIEINQRKFKSRCVVRL